MMYLAYFLILCSWVLMGLIALPRLSHGRVRTMPVTAMWEMTWVCAISGVALLAFDIALQAAAF